MGDGPQAAQLPAPVAALGLPEVASQASPADWFLTVTLGNMDNFMPPFNSLSEQERWDVVAYAQSLSRTSEQVSQGEQLFNQNCADCPTDFFSNQEGMAALSTNDLVNMLASGGEGIPALGDKLSQDQLGAVAAYLRTLTLSDSSLAAEPASGAQAESPSAAGTPEAGAEQPGATPDSSAVSVETGPISGKLVNGSGGEMPAGAVVTLHGFDHTTDPNSTPQEVVTKTVEADANGAFTFDDVSYPEGRIFLAEASYKDVVFQSDLVVVKADMDEVTIPDITVYEYTA
jgi:mono/diheme cytochrome c family protein